MMVKAGQAAIRDDAATPDRRPAGVYRKSVEPSHSQYPGRLSHQDEMFFLKCLIKVKEIENSHVGVNRPLPAAYR